MKVLVDANVILDVLLNRLPWATDSRAVWNANVQGRVEGYIVATVVTNLFYVARKSIGQALALRGVCDCLSAFEILTVDRAILADAAKLSGSDFEDNVSISCAVASGMDLIVTRDVSGFTQIAVPAVSPAELLARLSKAGP